MSAWGAAFPCYYFGVGFWGLGVYGQVVPDSDLLNPGNSPLIVFGVLGLVFIAMGAGFTWLLSLGAIRVKRQPSQPVAGWTPLGAGAKDPASAPLMRWSGRAGMWAVVVYVSLGICAVGGMLWGTLAWALSSRNGWLGGAVVYGWVLAGWFVWVMRWAANRVGPITLTMYESGFSYTNSSATPTYIAYADVADMYWKFPIGGRVEGQGGLMIVPRSAVPADGIPFSIMDRYNQWFIDQVQFSSKQWAQIEENLGPAVRAAGGGVTW